jgi:hypothetical protein
MLIKSKSSITAWTKQSIWTLCNRKMSTSYYDSQSGRFVQCAPSSINIIERGTFTSNLELVNILLLGPNRLNATKFTSNHFDIINKLCNNVKRQILLPKLEIDSSIPIISESHYSKQSVIHSLLCQGNLATTQWKQYLSAITDEINKDINISVDILYNLCDNNESYNIQIVNRVAQLADIGVTSIVLNVCHSDVLSPTTQMNDLDTDALRQTIEDIFNLDVSGDGMISRLAISCPSPLLKDVIDYGVKNIVTDSTHILRTTDNSNGSSKSSIHLPSILDVRRFSSSLSSCAQQGVDQYDSSITSKVIDIMKSYEIPEK